MFFPVGDDNPTRSVPVLTWLLIAANAAVYVLVNLPMSEGELETLTLAWGFDADHPFSRQVFTSMFLHGGFPHLAGNMWLLWIVGNNVEDKLGKLRYLLVYLLGGVAAAWTYAAIAHVSAANPEVFRHFGRRSPPVVGASGAIACIMGVYLVFFPEARIRVLVWFFLFLRVFGIRAKWFIGSMLLLDLVQSILAHGPAAGGVATAAHVGGGVFGIAAALWLKGAVGGGGTGDRWDVETGFSKRAAGRAPTPPQHEASRSRHHPMLAPRVEVGGPAELADAIASLVREGRVREAIDVYPAYVALAHGEPLPGDVQIDIAHEFFRQGLPKDALAAYAAYLRAEPAGEDAPEAKFRLGMLHSRWFHRPADAARFLREAAREHPDPSIAAFAAEELRRLGV